MPGCVRGCQFVLQPGELLAAQHFTIAEVGLVYDLGYQLVGNEAGDGRTEPGGIRLAGGRGNLVLGCVGSGFGWAGQDLADPSLHRRRRGIGQLFITCKQTGFQNVQ